MLLTHTTAQRSGPQVGYLTCQPTPAACVVHLPERQASGHGIVVCSPLGGPELFTYRVRRHWAEALAAAGHYALRIDLPGVGESVGNPLSGPSVPAWMDALGTAAAWLRDEAGCARITLLGISSAALIGWAAAAGGIAIDDLILWGMPLNGRQLLRELRAAAALSIDPFVPQEVLDTYGPAFAVDESGQPMSEETRQQISEIEPARLGLGERRVLLLSRPRDRADDAIRALLTSGGDHDVQLTVGDGSEYGDIMRYVQATITPQAAIGESLRWLEAAPGVNPPAATRHPILTEGVEFAVGAHTVRERTASLALSTGTATAVITAPVDTPPVAVTALFFNASADRRDGPNRLHVETARRWAARGVTSVRIDPPGIGDAPGDEQRWNRIWDILAASKTTEAREMVEGLRAMGLPRGFALIGFCSGAYRALQVAAQEPDVVAVGSIAPPDFRRSWLTVWVRDHWIRRWKPEPRHGRTRIVLVHALQAGLRVFFRVHEAVRHAGPGLPNQAERLLTKLATNGTHVLVILDPAERSFERVEPRQRRARLGRFARLRFAVLPSSDYRFRPAPAQAWVADCLDRLLDRLLVTEPTETD